MQLHSLKRKTPNRKKAYVGRGGKRGKTSGKGMKGQNSRAGRKKRPEMRDIIKKLPKLRGRGKNSFLSIQIKPKIVNLGDIEAVAASGDTVNVEYLVTKGLIRRFKGGLPKVKVLGSGTISKKITLTNVTASESAKVAIEKAGGKVN